MSSNREKKSTRSSESVKAPHSTADSFPSTISAPEILITNPRTERSLNADSEDDERILHSTGLGQYAGEKKAQGPSALHPLKTSRATADSCPSTISLAGTSTPRRMERSLNADSADVEHILPHSTVLGEYVKEIESQGPSALESVMAPRRPRATANSFPSTILDAGTSTTNPRRLERSLNADSEDDEHFLPYSTGLGQYVTEIQAQDPSVLESGTAPRAAASSFPSTILEAGTSTTNPRRTERSLNAESEDEERILHSTGLGQYARERLAQDPSALESLKAPRPTADSFPSTISAPGTSTTNPRRLERSLNVDSEDDELDEHFLPYSTGLGQYPGERLAQGPSALESVKSSRATTDSIRLEIPTTNPRRLERSLNADSEDDEHILPHSTVLEEYVGEIQAQVPSILSNVSSIIQNQSQPPKVTVTDPTGSHLDARAVTSSSTNLRPLRIISSIQTSPHDDYNPTSKDYRRSLSHHETYKSLETSSNAGTNSGKSSSENDRAVVEDYPSDNQFDSFDGTMHTIKSMAPAPVDESDELKSILARLHQEVQNSVKQASTSVGNKGSSTNLSRETSKSAASYNSSYIEAEPNEYQKPKQMFTYSKYKAPKNSQLQAKSQAVNSSTSNNSTVAEVRIAPENTEESGFYQSRLSSDNSKLSNLKSGSVQTSRSEEVLSEMGLYQKEVETWLRKVVAVVKEELDTLYHNKAKRTKSTTHPDSLLKKSSKKKKKSKKKFPYYPSGVIIPSCKGKKKAVHPKAISKRQIVFSEMLDSYRSTDERSPGNEDEGEYDESDQFNYHPNETSGYSAPLNSDVSDKSNTDDAVYDADYDEEYEEKQSELSLKSGRSLNAVEVRSTYVHQWIGNNNALKDSNSNEIILDKATSDNKQNSFISNLQNSNRSIDSHATKSTKRTSGKPKRSDSCPVKLSIETATEVFEEVLRECKKDGEIFYQKLAERFSKMQITGLRRMAIQKRLHEAEIRRAVLMDSKLIHLRSKSAKRMEKSLSLAKDKIESENKACITKMVEAKLFETKGVLKLFKDTMESEKDTILEMKATQKSRSRKMYGEVNEQISKLENLLQRGTSDLDKISSKLRKTSSLDTIELLNSLHQKGYQQLQSEINKCISRICSSFLLQRKR